MRNINTQSKAEPSSNVISFPRIGQTIDKLKHKTVRLPVVSDARPISFNNQHDEYAKSFGIEFADTVYLDHPDTARDGDLVVVIHEGVHSLDTFSDCIHSDDSYWHICGVVLGVFKPFERIQRGVQ